MYYTRLCTITDDWCPSFYRFRVCPDSNYKLQRVFEVEEHTGELFIHQMLKEAHDYRKYETTKVTAASSVLNKDQGSLISYAYGFKLAKLAETLQKVEYTEMTDVGIIKFDKGEYYGTTSIEDFYTSEKDYFNWLLDKVIPVVKLNTSDYEKDNVDEFVEKIEAILNSHTFRESRKAYKIRLVPDRLSAVNLRIYNRSDFVTDVFLKELEEKLNWEVESIAREKYFQGIGGGLDYKIMEKFERLKKGEDIYRKPSELLEEAKHNFLKDKHSTPKRLGSFYEKDPEKLKLYEESERTKTIKEFSKQWIDETDSDKGLPDLTDKKQEIVDKKGVAISGVVPAKYTKEHVAASLYFFINFYMREVRKEELLKSGIIKDEEEFNEIIKSLCYAFQQNYWDFEKGHKPPEFLEETNDLEHHYKQSEKQKHKNKVKQMEEEEHKRYLRWTCSIEEALEMVADDMRNRKEEHRNIIRNGYAVREDAIHVEQKDKNKYRNQFLRVAEHGIIDSTNLGPTLENEVEAVMTKYQDQVVFNDKISFFRMEYLLYCLRELHYYDEDAFKLKDDISYYKKKLNEKDADIQRLRFNISRATYDEKNQLEKLQKEYSRFKQKLTQVDAELEMKKSIIKKLVWHMIEWKVKAKRMYGGDHYGVGLDTYWLPLNFNEVIDTDYDQEQYRLNLIEKVKQRITKDKIKPNSKKKILKAVEDLTTEAKHSRTILGYYNYADEKEELVFKKLIPPAEKTSNEILAVVPDKMRETFKNI